MENVTPDNLTEFARVVYEAARDGRWLVVAALGIVALVWATRKFAAPKVPFFATGEGGAILNLVTGFLLAIAGALIGGAPLSGMTLWVALQTSFVAAGGWSLVKNLLPFFGRFIPGLGAGDAQKSLTLAKSEGEKAAEGTKPRTAADIINGDKK